MKTHGIVLALIFGFAAIWLTGGQTIAQPAPDCSGMADSCRTVVPSIDAIEAGDYSGQQYTYIAVTCYHNSSTANSICAGGGDFDQIPWGNTGCTSPSLDNGATIIQDSHKTGGLRTPNCFFRKNFGLNGVVDARQCGVVGDGLPAQGSPGDPDYHPDDGKLLNDCMNIAATQPGSGALPNTYHIVTTGGGVVLSNNSPIDIPANTALTCSGIGTGQAKTPDVDNDDYRIFDKNGKRVLTNAIVLAPPFTVQMHHDNATYYGCTEEAGTGTQNEDGSYPNPYSPSIWYPNCTDPNTTDPCNEGGSPLLRSSIREYSAFNPHETAEYNRTKGNCLDSTHCGPASKSIGITLDTANHLRVRDVTVLGFGICYSAQDATGTPLPPTGNPATRLVIDHLMGDCDTGISVDDSGNFTRFNAFEIRPFLNSSLSNDAGALTLQVQALVEDALIGSTKYQATVDESGTDFRFQQYDTVWIATDTTTHAESAAGRWTVVNDPNDPAHPCTPSCQFLVLGKSLNGPDSQATSISLTTTITGIPPQASNAIAGFDPSPADTGLQLVAVGQGVSGPCVPSSTTVTDVWPAKGIVYLSAPKTCVPGPGSTFTFSDTGFSQGPNCTDPQGAGYNSNRGCATVNATQRFGDGIVITNSGGVSAVNCQVYEHLIAFHFSTNANSSRFSNCATGENASLPDQDIIGLKIDGDHVSSEGDACGNEFVNGVLGQHRTVGILVQSNCDTPNHLSNMRFSGNGGGRRNAVALELDAGNLAITNSDATGNDNVFKADGANLYYIDPDTGEITNEGRFSASLSIGNDQFPSGTLYMADMPAAGATISGCGNTFGAPTPYLCAPSSFTQLPGGRLTLTQAQPVMQSDVTGANTIYYVPYVSQQVPIYNPTAGVFGLSDIGTAGLTLILTGSAPAANTLFDIYVDTLNDGAPGVPELCAGPAWSSSAAGSSSRSAALDIRSVNGVWVTSNR